MRASGEGASQWRGALRGPADMAVNRLLYFQHWKIPINFQLNALLYSGRGLHIRASRRLLPFISSNLLLRFYKQESAWTPPKTPRFLRRCVPPADVSADASQLPQRLFGFAGLIPDGFESRVIRLSPKGRRACQVSPHISVALLTP